MSNNIHYKVWAEITYTFPNLKGANFELWEWIGNSIPHSSEYGITYPYWDLS